ncbi:sensor histidine kinase [Brevibacillus reuszeri]|uniref:sensor histidine kinase n=1 Tax=Brevibacillus reuszeri TaxID=54915 RepID=UPI00289872CC|nr:HAMP domain-containing sensor histidine kinase [Brevibacillus reuszeri]
MINSLYTRIVLSFLLSVIAGTVVSFFIATWVYEEQLNENLQLPLLHFAQDISRIYEKFPFDEANTFVQGMHQLKSYYIRIYDQIGQFKSFGDIQGQELAAITTDQVEKVLSGEVVQLNPSGLSTVMIGLPLHTEVGTKAIFVELIGPPSAPFILKWMLNFILYSLGLGSFFMGVATIYLVRPIKKLTKATKLIADGNFSVQLNIKQKGELGTLAKSFEEMAHELQQLEQMRIDFVSNVSHEVQSPLTSISGYARALKQVNVSENERKRYLDIIIAEANRMSKLSDSLLKLSLLESQSQLLKLQTYSLDEQIRRVIVALQPQWSARNIQFDLHLKAVQITADHDQLSQVWTNILGNSIKFSRDDGVIMVSIDLDTNTVIVRLSDNGIGISEEDQKRIFERFFKTDRSHNRKYEGSGMGLAITKKIVSLHDGDIRVESEPCKGTTMIVTLPISAQTDH